MTKASSQLVTICQQRGPLVACWNDGGTFRSIVAHFSYGPDGLSIPSGKIGSDGATEIGLFFTDLSGEILTSVNPADVTAGACSIATAPGITTETIAYGTNTNVPAGLKAVTINNLSGVTTLNGQYQLGGGRRETVASFSASSHATGFDGRLPGIALSGGSWQWRGVL